MNASLRTVLKGRCSWKANLAGSAGGRRPQRSLLVLAGIAGATLGAAEVGAAAIGYYLAAALGVEATPGIDWIRWIISIVVAAIVVMIAAS